MAIRIVPPDDSFSAWGELLELLHGAYAFMEQRIDPPSSVSRLTPTSLAAKSQEEALFLAMDEGSLVGCVFAGRRGDALYVSKLAVRQDRQGRGIGRRLMEAVEAHARDAGIPALELETRIQLAENHAIFAAMGFVKIAEHAHDGYNRSTFITMRKPLHPP